MEAFKIQFDGEPTSLKMKWKERVMGAPTFLVEQLAYFTGMVKNSMYQERFIELSTFSLYFKQLFLAHTSKWQFSFIIHFNFQILSFIDP